MLIASLLNKLLSRYLILYDIRHHNLIVMLYVMNLNVTGNVKNLIAQNQNVNWYVKTQVVYLK